MSLHRSISTPASWGLVLCWSILVQGGPLFRADVPLPGGATTSVVFYSGDTAYGRGSDVCRCHKVPSDECQMVIDFFAAQLPDAQSRGEILAQPVNIERTAGEVSTHVLTIHENETPEQSAQHFCDVNRIGRCEAVKEAVARFSGHLTRRGPPILEVAVYVTEGICLTGAPVVMHQNEPPALVADTYCALYDLHEGCDAFRASIAQSAEAHLKLGGPLGLDWLVAPSVVAEEFMEQYWQSMPLLVQRPNDRTRHQLLISSANLSTAILAAQRPNSSQSILVVNSSFEQSIDKFESVASAYLQGFSVVVHTVEVAWEPIAVLCRKLWGEMLYPSVNIYLSPIDGEAFPVHTDAQDVFILQVEGRKHWRVFEPPVLLPYKDEMRGKPNTTSLQPEELTMIHDVLLEPGDVLYIPRGFPHQAWPPKGDMSLHLTLTVPTHSYSLAKIVESAVTDALDENPKFRDAIPVEGLMWDSIRTDSAEMMFNQRLEDLIARVSLQSSVSKFLAKFHWFLAKSNQVLAPNATQREDSLWNILRAPSVTLDTMLTRVPSNQAWANCLARNNQDTVMRAVLSVVATIAKPGHHLRVRDLVGLDTFGQVCAAQILLHYGCVTAAHEFLYASMASIDSSAISGKQEN